MIVAVACAWSPSVGTVHVTTWPAIAHVPPVIVAVAAVTPGDSVSVTTTFVAGLGPLFVTVSCEVAVAPAVTGSGVVVFANDRSALRATGSTVSLPTKIRSSSSVGAW